MVLVEAFESSMSKSVPGKMLYKRRHRCFYCGISMETIYRHMLAKHKNEKSIVQIEDLRADKDNDEVRINLMRILKNKCDFKHNLAVLKENRGYLRVVRRPAPGTSQVVNPSNYFPCTQCFAFYSKMDLFKHKCPATGTRVGSENSALSDSRTFLEAALGKLSPILAPVLDEMKNDPVSEVVRSDPLIRQLISMELDKNIQRSTTKGVKGPKPGQQKARMLGRFLLFVRKRYGNPDLQFKDVLVPERFDIAIDCAKWMAGENKSFLTKLMHVIHKATNVLKGQAISSGDEALLEKFQTLRIMMEDNVELSMYLASDSCE